jgi:nicotinamide riboside kinase
MHLVMINGAPKSGKSHLAMQLQERLRFSNSRSVLRAGLVDCLRVMLIAFYGHAGGQSEPYEATRDRDIIGRTGREWMILWAAAMRAKDPEVFPKLLHARIQEHIKVAPNTVFIIDDLGFQNEHDFFYREYGSKLTVVYMEKRTQRVYGHGAVFENDIRQCLRMDAHLVDPSAEEVVSQLTRLENITSS